MTPSIPQSIDAYLQALRAELAGADPALVQDALYDAEEHLRAEAAASPGTSEADLLARIVPTYGSPAEIAAAYRDTEGKVAAALQPPVARPAPAPGAAARFFAVYSDPGAYIALFFMILSLVTGSLYFTFAVTGLSLSLGLAILIIGLPVFLGFVGLTRVISLAEGRLLEAVTGERMPRRPVHPGPPAGLIARSVEAVKDPRTWTTMIYLIVMLPLGVVYFTLAVTGLSLGLALTLFPFFAMTQRLGWQWVATEPDLKIWTKPAWLDSPFGWIVCVVLGIFILTALLHAARGIVGAHARTAKTLLVAH